MSEYLAPAIAELKGLAKGDVAGQVFHQYASFCDAQLHNPDLNADFDRIQRMRDTRTKELEHWKQVGRATKDKVARDRIQKEFRKASNWFKLDDTEYKRLKNARESFMTQSLENYLLALSASDSHDNDVLRFFALWLEFADSDLANTSVGKHLASVSTAKFVRLMNQLSSRLQHDQTPFQDLLSELVLHIAIDHPYHAMHHISAGSSPVGVKASESAKSRMNATKTIVGRLKGAKDTKTSATWHNISSTDQMYHNLAVLHDNKTHDTIFKAGRDLALDDFREGRSLTTKIKDFKLPPPTMDIPVRYDKNYRNVPKVTGFLPKMKIANGLSAPKIVVARCSDGQTFKQLVRPQITFNIFKTTNLFSSSKAALTTFAKTQLWSKFSRKLAGY
jgi:serine-protein kinase ATM